MKFRRIIKNGTRKTSVVQKFNKDDLKTPIEEVTYAMPPLPALTYYYMQFIMKDFAWERYPRYIQGTIRSSKVKDVYYYDKLDGIIIRSSPYTYGEKWKFHSKPKKSKLPERKKHLVLKEVVRNADTNREDGRRSGTDIVSEQQTHTQSCGTLSERKSDKHVERSAEQFNSIRNRVHSIRKRTGKTNIIKFAEREPEVKVVAECSCRPKLKRGSKNKQL